MALLHAYAMACNAWVKKTNTKISKTHILLNKILLSLSARLSLSLHLPMLTATCASFALLKAEFYQFLETVLRETCRIPRILNVTSDHSCRNSFVFLFENCFLQVKPR